MMEYSEKSEKPENDLIDKNDVQVSAEHNARTENVALDNKSDLLDTGHEKDSPAVCRNSFDRYSKEECVGERQKITVQKVEYTITDSSSPVNQVMDLRTHECVKRGSYSCLDSATVNAMQKSSNGVTLVMSTGHEEFLVTSSKTEDASLLSGGKADSDIETETVADIKPGKKENSLEIESKTVTSIHNAIDVEQVVDLDNETFEVYETHEGKVSNCARNQYDSETSVIDESVVTDSKITVKEETDAEEFTVLKRPKRKRSSLVNYDESELLDLDPLFEVSAAGTVNNVQTKRPRKLRSPKESNEKIRTVHSDSHFIDMFKNFHKLQKGGKYCDVKICGTNGGILAHSIVIIAASPLLHKKFKQKVKTVTDLNHVTDLDFKDIPLWALEIIVSFLYTGDLEVLDKDAKQLSKHCKTLGLNDLHMKLNSKPCKDLEDTEVKAEIEPMNNKKSRKRKLKTGNSSEVKAKVSKESSNLSEAALSEENEVIVKVETSENTFEVVDTDKSTQKESGQTEAVHTSDFENEVIEDIDANNEWMAGFDDSGDDTDSYFENENVRKKSKRKKKRIKNTTKKRSKKKEKQEKEKNVKGKIKTPKHREKVVAESENKSKENHLKLIETVAAESKREMQIDDRVNSDESREKISFDIGAGNGGECDKCGKSFYFQNELTGHRNKCTGKNNRQRRKCITCHVNFESTEEYMDHRNNDERCIALRQEKLVIRKQKRFEMRRKFCCCACPRKFRRLADQVEHEFLAHEIRYDKEKWPDLYCEYCNYWSMNPWKLHHHKLVSCNKGQEPICDMCGNSYKNEKTLKKHKELMHTDVQPMLTCEECGKTLKGHKGLKHHIRLRHRGENLHNLMMCHICSQTYRTSSDLTFHLYRVHDQPLPEGFTVYRCPKCDYCHNNKRFFNKHMFLHEDKREWHCEICSKAFKTKNSLSTHMIVHTSSRIPCPFDDCTYKALKNCHLKNHIENQHTQKGEKHEKCHLCEYSTFFRGNLIKHQRSVHKLEVVTRHSVEMKAKYKNLKSGQIVGVDNNSRNEKKFNHPRTGNTEYQTSNLEIGTVRESGYPASSSSDNSMVENQRHFQEKSVPMPPSQNVADSFVYTLVNAPMMSSHSNYPANANMYRMPPIDFSVYNQNSSMDQM